MSDSSTSKIKNFNRHTITSETRALSLKIIDTVYNMIISANQILAF